MTALHAPAPTPLAHTRLEVAIDDLLATYELRHDFRNTGVEPIEAVYTFPIPLDAAFLGMQATLAGQTMAAQVLPARQASHRYDQAIGDGDSAVLLEQLEPGLLCVNLGNLLPDETGQIVLRFVAALGVSAGVARFSLPLVHRPRYGSYGFDALAVPRADFAVQHPLQAHIRVRGLLCGCPVQCASAGARFTHTPDETRLDVSEAMLDRDLVLRFDLAQAPAPRATLIEDGDDSIALLSGCLPLPQAQDASAARDICLLLDGSGSMAGDAIAQSRQALLALADALLPADRIQAIRFGDQAHALLRRPLRASPAVKNALRQLASAVQADLGGTDLAGALNQALDALAALDGPASARLVILVTDGAVQPEAVSAALQRARRQRVRIFVVAVGSSAGVDVLAPLAARTGATLERAVPAEPIDAGVLRQLQRARSVPLALHIDWGSAGTRPLPLAPVYPGDAFTALALCTGQEPLAVQLSTRPRHPACPPGARLDTGRAQSAPALRAWAGQQAWADARGARQKENLALRYGLITEQTRAVLVQKRADGSQTIGLPRVQSVPHMLAAGMLETVSSARARFVKDITPCVLRKLRHPSRSDKLRSFIDNLTPDELAQPALPPLSLLPDAADRDALAQALAKLLLAGIDRPDLGQLLARIDPARHAVVAAYIDHGQADPASPQAIDAAALLRLLLDAGARIVLNDDQEARLSVALCAPCI
jgi:Ca-activated chloride channel family protein